MTWFTGLMIILVIGALSFLIYGIVTKRNGVWVGSLIAILLLGIFYFMVMFSNFDNTSSANVLLNII